MGKVYETIDDHVQRFIAGQKMFFVASAPLDADGLVNLSPKGLDTFRVLGPNRVAYLDLGGSGIETVAHLNENGRIVFMFCAMEGRPRILRLYGKGRVHQRDDPAYAELRPRFPDLPGERTIIDAQIHRIADSCGFAVPRYTFDADRDQLTRLHAGRDDATKVAKEQQRSIRSLDGLPGLRVERDR